MIEPEQKDERSDESDFHQKNHAEFTQPEKHVMLFLRVIGGTALLAYGAAVMPSNWIVQASEFLGFDPFPDSPLTFYLARNLSLLYGVLGVGLLVIAFDFQRYRPSVWYVAVCGIAGGGLQLIADWMSELPAWWTVGESVSTILGCCFLLWLHRRAELTR